MFSSLSAIELAGLLRSREVTSVEVVQHFLERMSSDECGAFVDVTPGAAMARAEELDGSSPRGALHGMPIADKDLQLRAGTRTTYGSRAHAELVAQESDDVVRACDAAGAVSLGKTASPEFGYAAYTSSVLHGHTTVPGHPELGAGGSSGGAAAAVAARMLPFAPGSDAAGSIRIPAAACGVVGIKPSRGAALPVKDGPMGDLPVPGALGRSVADAWLLLSGMFGGPFETALRASSGTRPSGVRASSRTGAAGVGASSRTRTTGLRSSSETGAARVGASSGAGAAGVGASSGAGAADVGVSGSRTPLRIGILRDFRPWQPITDGDASDEAEAAISVAASCLKEAGHLVEEFAGPALPGYSDAFQTAWHASAAAMSPTDEQLEQFEPLTAHFVRSGRLIPPENLEAAQDRLEMLGALTREAFAPYDAVITHTTALTPRRVGWFTDDPETNFRRQCEYAPHTSFVNVAGLPAVSLPVLELSDGLTMSVQIIGRHAEDRLIVALAEQLEEMCQ